MNHADYMKRYREKYPELVKASIAASKAKNPEKYREHVRVWRENNVERCRELRKNWRQKNPKKNCDIARKWRQTENGRLYIRRRVLLRTKIAGPAPSKEELKELLAKFKYECAYCGRHGPLHIDHVLAVTKGGTNSISNLVPACRSCNVSKGNLDWKVWYRAKPFYDAHKSRRITRKISRHD